MTTVDRTQVLIIGAGLMGTAAAHHLAERGYEVTVVERDVPAGRFGSSHGSARIFRYAYPEPFYTQFAIRARARYDELERLAGERLISDAGAIDFGPLRDPRHLANLMAEHDVDHEVLSPERAAERWPGITFDSEVLWQPGGGVIDAQATTQAQLRLAEAAGARVLLQWEAERVVRDGTGYRVTSAKGEVISARQVVLAAGGWLSRLLEGVELPSRFAGRLPRPVVLQENAFHFPFRDDADWPTLIHHSERILTYGLPGGRDADYRGLKVAEFLGGTEIADASAQTGVVNPANRERLIDYVRDSLPGVVPEPYGETTCLFTMLPNDDFLLDAADGLVIASPCSGHGAKFAPLIGEMVAELIDGREPEPRFAVR